MSRTSRPAKKPLRWTGVLFAFAANLLLVTLGDALARVIPGGINTEMLATVVAPLIAGAATAVYAGDRGGMHALFGAGLALPVLGLVIFRGVWPLAIFATCFCIMGAAIMEIVVRRQPSRKSRKR